MNTFSILWLGSSVVERVSHEDEVESSILSRAIFLEFTYFFEVINNNCPQ